MGENSTTAAGSPGQATGRARVVHDAYADEPPEPGEVLSRLEGSARRSVEPQDQIMLSTQGLAQ